MCKRYGDRTRWRLLCAIVFLCCRTGFAEDLKLELRTRPAGERSTTSERAVVWDGSKTALIICDMWDKHHCKAAERRVGELAPAVNKTVESARAKGVFVIHAPSDCMPFYEGQPGRKLAQSAPRAKDLPADIDEGCQRLPAEEKARYPIDQADGGCDCGPACPEGAPWTRQHAAIEIKDGDAISASGSEIWNMLRDRKIEHVILLGVHTNMCVSGRPFGLRNLVKNGMDVVLARDLTDTMYNSRSWPFVDHHEGTKRYVAYVEETICPTIVSSAITGAAEFAFSDIKEERRRAVFIIGDDEYKTAETLPAFAAKELEPAGIRCTFIIADPKTPHDFPALEEAVKVADVLFVSARRRAPTPAQLDAIRAHLAAGKPLIGIRTACHAFDARGKGPAGHAEWPGFDPEVLGGHYHGHHAVGPITKLTAAPSGADHPIMRGVTFPFSGHGSLYQVSPLAGSTRVLIGGVIPGCPPEPVAWVNSAGKARVFYTSLGHPDDFNEPSFRTLLRNATTWALERP